MATSEGSKLDMAEEGLSRREETEDRLFEERERGVREPKRALGEKEESFGIGVTAEGYLRVTWVVV